METRHYSSKDYLRDKKKRSKRVGMSLRSAKENCQRVKGGQLSTAQVKETEKGNDRDEETEGN